VASVVGVGAIMKSPYDTLSPEKFWKSGAADTDPLTVAGLYTKKFPIAPQDRIATAGSCFAQHITRQFRDHKFTVMDLESPPHFMPDDLQRAYGFSLYSARYGNIYTVRHLLQLAQDAFARKVDASDVWLKDGRWYDAIRPSVDPRGFESVEEALANRRNHLTKVRAVFETMQVFFFTLGLTEAWTCRKTGRVYPVAPGIIAGDYDPELFEFRNFGFNDVYDDFFAFYRLIHEHNPEARFVLTVSPVPLTATASDNHVLVATTYSKSVLRSAAGALCAAFADIDYFPSYEIIASHWSKSAFFEPNMRSITPAGVAAVMRIFFAAHGVQSETGAEVATASSSGTHSVQASVDDLERERRRKERKRARREQRRSGKEVCDDLLLDTFAP
jgi:hypothetical protein